MANIMANLAPSLVRIGDFMVVLITESDQDLVHTSSIAVRMAAALKHVGFITMIASSEMC